ncbi:hypothetical protein [Streptomyces sp. Qhu_M48]
MHAATPSAAGSLSEALGTGVPVAHVPMGPTTAYTIDRAVNS